MAAEKLLPHLSKIRSPFGGEKVYKDECCFCFDTPECETGLYVCMNTFLGFGKKYVEQYQRKTGNSVFLHMRRIKKEIPKPPEDDAEKKKPTKLAIGVEGGFDTNEKKYEYEEKYAIVVLPDWTEFTWPDPNLPDMVQVSALALISAESASKLDDAAALAGTWEGEQLRKSKHADNLLQLDNGKKIPPKGWKCEKCDLTDNLWLNLTDGSILCGRKFFDGTGGNNHALDHYAQVKYPLAVKLGTITPDGGDVFSYDEDDMVLDPHLAKHLAHFGINIMDLEKTDKTMLELEIDLNQRIGEWDVIQEAGSQLKPVYGPGYTGMVNLGNSCYMNSLMQVVFTLPDFQRKYVEPAERLFQEASPADAADNFNVQMAKLGHGLLSGDYSKPPKEPPAESSQPVIKYQEGIRPAMFKRLIGRGHPEFSTKRQQDVQEFLLHLTSVTERHSRGSENPTDCLRYQLEERIQCVQSGKVKYTTSGEYLLGLNVPLEAATNKEEVAAYEAKKKQLEEQGQKIDPKELVRPRVPLAACLANFTAPEIIPDFYSTALQAKSNAQKTTRLKTFPDYLVIHLKKFTIGDDWVPKKMDVSVDIPDELDLSALRGQGLQLGEQELPEGEAPAPAEPEIQLDMEQVSQLASMGFSIEGCKKAVFHTKNAGIESAMEWVMQHMGDPDFGDPFVPPSAKKPAGGFVPNEEGLMMIMALGFNRDQATKALKATDNNVERAADWVFSHADELDTPMETDQPETSEAGQAGSKFRDYTSKYRLVAFISHMGTSPHCGHYVCHILKEGRWVIFNDEKVALSEHPPKDLAYLYFYQRI